MEGSVKFNDRVWRKLLARVNNLGDQHVRVGVFGDGQSRDDGASNVEIAAIHEYGSQAAGIPERSFIRATLRAKDASGELASICKRLARGVVRDQMDHRKALEILGAQATTWIKGAITEGDGISPPLHPATVARKGSSRPLVDTGQLINSITWKVSNE
jgi:phage gpG-like protein